MPGRQSVAVLDTLPQPGRVVVEAEAREHWQVVVGVVTLREAGRTPSLGAEPLPRRTDNVD